MPQKSFLAAIFLIALNLPSTAATPAQNATISSVVTDCVDEARKGGFNQFDAFYNQGTGRVENNVIYVADQGALFIFDKCMASHGVPLGPGK